MSTRDSASDPGLTAARGEKPESNEATFGAFVRKPAARRVAIDASGDAGSIEFVEVKNGLSARLTRNQL